MRMCACLWGGFFNPIIPVFDRLPAEWKSPYERSKGSAVAKGYVKFFEPDVYVEATSGLLEKAGLSALRQEHGLHTLAVTLADFFKPEDARAYSEPAFGLNIHDALVHIYQRSGSSCFVKSGRAF